MEIPLMLLPIITSFRNVTKAPNSEAIAEVVAERLNKWPWQPYTTKFICWNWYTNPRSAGHWRFFPVTAWLQLISQSICVASWSVQSRHMGCCIMDCYQKFLCYVETNELLSLVWLHKSVGVSRLMKLQVFCTGAHRQLILKLELYCSYIS